MTVAHLANTSDEFFAVAVTDTYREVVSGAPPEDGINRNSAIEEAITRLRPRVESGELAVPLDFALRRALDRADESDGKSSDKILSRIVSGQLPLDVDAWLDTVVTLGDGLRKPLRYLRDNDLRDMDANRYRNLRNAQNAYDEWRTTIYEPALDAVLRHGMLSAAIAAGAFEVTGGAEAAD